MLPDGVLSTEIIKSSYDNATALPITQYIDYEDGGIALNDPSEGLLYQIWTARITRNVTTGNDEIWVAAEHVDPVLFRAAVGITEVSIAFDRNMQLHVAYVEGGESFLRWYDTTVPGFVTTNYGSTVITPRITHDDKRQLQTANSDIILAYIKSGDLYYRQQRDRFDTEYLLQADINSPGLIKIGMNKQLRLQFLLKYT